MSCSSAEKGKGEKGREGRDGSRCGGDHGKKNAFEKGESLKGIRKSGGGASTKKSTVPLRACEVHGQDVACKCRIYTFSDLFRVRVKRRGGNVDYQLPSRSSDGLRELDRQAVTDHIDELEEEE